MGDLLGSFLGCVQVRTTHTGLDSGWLWGQSSHPRGHDGPARWYETVGPVTALDPLVWDGGPGCYGYG